jgi:hypothetical protein
MVIEEVRIANFFFYFGLNVAARWGNEVGEKNFVLRPRGPRYNIPYHNVEIGSSD